MNWFDKLKSLVDANINFFNSPTSKINFFSNNNTKNIVLNINIPQPIASESKETERIFERLSDILKEGIAHESEHRLLTESSDKKLKLVSNLRSADAGVDKLQLDFVTTVLPEKDRSLWVSALILKSRSEHRDVNTVKSIKMDLMLHGDRGKNIANLCTAGYLESEIMPLHEYLVNQVGDYTQFDVIYEEIVTQYPRAVFVSGTATVEEVEGEITGKIHTLNSAGWKKLNVHAYGEDNVKKSIEALASYQKKANLTKISLEKRPPRPTHHVLIEVTIIT